jgi:hypothetical protein
MNSMPWPPKVGEWYLRSDQDEVFQVVAYDEHSHRALLQPLQSDPCQIDQAGWERLSLGLADPPQDEAGPWEAIDVVDFGRTSEAPVSEDVAAPRGELD